MSSSADGPHESKTRLSTKVARGVAWAAGAQAIIAVADIVSTILVMAVWVPPEDWGIAAGFGRTECLDEPGDGEACTATSDCGHCCDLRPRSDSALEQTCADWGDDVGWHAPTCGAACGEAGLETLDCWHCCDLGD